MEGLAFLGKSLAGLLGPWQIFYALGATLVGIVIGILPGLSATLGSRSLPRSPCAWRTPMRS
jgi:putative tricarboxylic transport membrane protein